MTNDAALDRSPAFEPQQIVRLVEVAGLGFKHSAADVAAEHDVALLPIEHARLKRDREKLRAPAAGVPAVMIFVRNQNGSHNPDEAMRMDDFELAARVIARAVAGLS